MAVAPDSPLTRPVETVLDPAPRRVRHEVADGAAVVAFSLGTSVVIAVLLSVALHLAG